MPPNAAAPAATGVIPNCGIPKKIAAEKAVADPKIAAGANSNANGQPMLSPLLMIEGSKRKSFPAG